MAEKKEAPKVDPVANIGFILLVMLFIWVIWSTILDYYLLSRYGSYGEIARALLRWFMHYIYPALVVLSALISIGAIYGIFKNYNALVKLNKAEREVYGAKVPLESIDGKKTEAKNERWEGVQKHINSTNQGDWRLAIIEADLILEEMLRAQGYHGDSIGEMLKGIERSDMTTLDFAWEAHKTRNEIVHSGSGYLLNERDAKRVVSLYEAVFREFEMI
jgi:hypothetical protein